MELLAITMVRVWLEQVQLRLIVWCLMRKCLKMKKEGQNKKNYNLGMNN